jgi:hypothetical protein
MELYILIKDLNNKIILRPFTLFKRCVSEASPKNTLFNAPMVVFQ